jgi:hypothetical protein
MKFSLSHLITALFVVVYCASCSAADSSAASRETSFKTTKSASSQISKASATSGLFRLMPDQTISLALKALDAAGDERVEVTLSIVQSNGRVVETVTTFLSKGNPAIIELPRNQVSSSSESVYLSARVEFVGLERLSSKEYPVIVSVESAGLMSGAGSRADIGLDLVAPSRWSCGGNSAPGVTFLCEGWASSFEPPAQ